MTDSRIPTHLVVSGLLRQISAEGGNAVILAKGDRESGTYVLLLRNRSGTVKLVERRPSADFAYQWQVTQEKAPENEGEIYEYCDRRSAQDDDLWIVEAQIDDIERFIARKNIDGFAIPSVCCDKAASQDTPAWSIGSRCDRVRHCYPKKWESSARTHPAIYDKADTNGINWHG